MYLGPKIWRRLNKYGEKNLKGTLTRAQLEVILQDMVAPFGAKAEVGVENFISKKYKFSIGGEYFPGQYKRPVVVQIYLRADTGSLYFTPKRRKMFLFDLSQTLQHELVHKSQYEARKENFYTKSLHFTKGSSKTGFNKMIYLSMAEEIDAYAHDLAMEIKYHYPNENPNEILKNLSQYKKLYTWKLYSSTFKKARWLHVRNELLRKTYRWLPYIKEKFA